MLEEAGITKARGLILTLSDDSDNVYATLTAKALNPDMRVIARANDPQSTKLLLRAGAERAMNLADAEAAAIARASINPAVADFLEMVNISRDLGLDFSAATLHPESPVAGKTLAEAPLRFEYNAMVIAIKKEKGSIIYNPPGNEILEGGDELILFAEMDKMEELRSLLCRPGGTGPE
ncbi:MAG TPA: NAD-binding protein [Synergistales bacterium]|nr:NAD-binding protein [Synergistales bacterium]HRV71865.1 NAD-binding protein [Thermovirgaceae bacterium]